MKTDHSGPAFPTRQFYDERPIGEYEGMSLRQMYAVQAMNGILSAVKTAGGQSETDMAKNVAGFAFLVADAMITAERGQ